MLMGLASRTNTISTLSSIRWKSALIKSHLPPRPRGKRSSTTTQMPRSADAFAYSKSRVFTKEYLTRFGARSSLDDVVLILNPGNKQKNRRLDEKKKKQLEQLYFETVAGIVCEIPEAAEHRLVITKVDIPNHMTNVKVYWRAFGDVRDVKLRQILEDNSESVRKTLSQTLYQSNVPKVVFVADREHLLMQEMNQLFEVADYGMQYRALSRTGAVLGSLADSGESTDEKQAKIPRFMRAKMEKQVSKVKEREEEKLKNKPLDSAPALEQDLHNGL